MEGFLASAVGCKLFAVFARARLGDLKSISKFTLDTSDGVDGFLECFRTPTRPVLSATLWASGCYLSPRSRAWVLALGVSISAGYLSGWAKILERICQDQYETS